MLLRNVKKHVEDQNWFAVALDFFIVVAGVFIGIQLGNWNDAHQTQLAFSEAQNNLTTESQSNLEMIDSFLEDVDTRLTAARGALTELRECDTGDAAAVQILQGVNAIRGTPTLHLRQTALSAITGNDAFLSLLDKEERERLKELQRSLSQSQATLNWLEERPFEDHIEDAPYLDYSELIPLPSVDGIEIRNLTLSAPVALLCKDPVFLKPFYIWERTATFQSLRARQVQGFLSENIATQ